MCFTMIDEMKRRMKFCYSYLIAGWTADYELVAVLERRWRWRMIVLVAYLFDTTLDSRISRAG